MELLHGLLMCCVARTRRMRRRWTGTAGRLVFPVICRVLEGPGAAYLAAVLMGGVH